MRSAKAVWVLNRLSGFGIQKFKRLREELGDLNRLFEPETLKQLAMSSECGHGFLTQFQELSARDDFERELDLCLKSGIKILTLVDLDYPKALASIYDPPLILYIKGTLVPEDEAAIAIVGTRHPSVYGLGTALRFASELAEKGLTIISGFARGIDGEAHRGALKAKGRTIAVLGSGLDVIYPKEHSTLYQEIEANGALVSEFPLGTPPRAFNFPKRNRIISGFAMGVLVIEASQRSGSLITARVAAEEGREVYAVPGPIDSITSYGTNQLIQSGAKLVAKAEDILEDLTPQIRASLSSWQISKAGLIKEDALFEKASNDEEGGDIQEPILRLLSDQPLSFDEISICLQENPIQIRSHLTQLEIQGIVKRVFGGRYVRN